MDTRVYHYPIKKCQSCGVEYQPNNGRQKYCIKCGKYEGQATCEQCGKVFSLTGGTTGRFCSRACWYSFFGGEKMALRDCPVCGKTFKPRLARQKTCSRECGSKIQRRELKVCRVCGKEFDSKRSNQVACSNQCAGILKQKAIISNCQRCGRQMRVTGFLERKFCSSECRKTPLGTRRKTNQGYVSIRVANDYPGANPKSWILEHRYVMEQNIGRSLMLTETIHHINGDRTDNRIENLELRDGKHGKGIRVTDKFVDALLSHKRIVELGSSIVETIRDVSREIRELTFVSA